MLSLFQKKSTASSTSSDSMLAVRSNTPASSESIVTGSTALSIESEDYCLLGFGDAVEKNCVMRHIPTPSISNAIVTVTFASGIASAATSMLADQTPAPVNQTQFAVNLLGWGLSGGTQLLEYFKKFKHLQDDTLMLIKGLPMDAIAECYSASAQDRVNLEEAFSHEAILSFLRTNGSITIVFNSPDTKINLYDFSICTTRVGATAAAAGVATLATQSISIGYFLAEQSGLINAEQASLLKTVSTVTSGAPILKVATKLVETCNTYTNDFLSSLNTVITKLYIEPKQLHTISEEILMVASKYCSDKDMLRNRKFIKALREDPESGFRPARPTLRLTSGTP